MALNQKSRLLLKRFGKLKAKEPETAANSLRFLDDLFELQRDISNDESKYKALLAGRRSGKSKVAAAMLIKSALETSRSENLFLALTISNAHRILWRYLRQTCEDYGIQANFNNSLHVVTFPNESVIYVAGCPTLGEAEKWRGSAYKLVFIDEAGSYGDHLEYLLDEVLGMAKEDYQGSLVLSGTPNRYCAGYFHKVTTEKTKYKCWEWNVFDNPKFPRWADQPDWQEKAQLWWTNYLEEEGIAETSNLVQREWFARWVRDEENLVYILDDFVNIIEELPSEFEPYSSIIGMDFGFNDPFALVAGKYSKYDNKLYIVDMYDEAHMLTDDKAKLVSAWDEKYRPSKIVLDPGGGGKQFIEDFNAKYKVHVSIDGAQKQEKLKYMDLLAEYFKAGRVVFVIPNKDSKLYTYYTQLATLLWRDREKLLITGPDHVADALIYLTREWMPTSNEAKDVPVKSEVDPYYERRIREIRRQQKFEQRMGRRG